MSMSLWQIEVIRAALRAHRAYYWDSEKRSHTTWTAIAEAIADYTGASMTAEVLRQFVEGVSKKKPDLRRVPNQTNIDAIIKYLSDSDIDALSPDELDEHKFQFQPALRLISYLAQKTDKEVIRPPDKLNGTYQSIFHEYGKLTCLNLTLHVDEETGIVHVSEMCDVYESQDNKNFEEWNQETRDRSFLAHKESWGWSIITPEDNFLVFMKEMPFLANHYFILAKHIDFWTDRATDLLPLLRFDYPMEHYDQFFDQRDMIGDYIEDATLREVERIQRDQEDDTAVHYSSLEGAAEMVGRSLKWSAEREERIKEAAGRFFYESVYIFRKIV